MKQLLKVSRILRVSHRFKSKPADNQATAWIIKRLNYENKLLFGKLLKSPKDKIIRPACKENANLMVNNTVQNNSKKTVEDNVSVKPNKISEQNKRRAKYLKAVKTEKDATVSKKTETEAAAEFLKTIPLSTIKKRKSTVKSNKSGENRKTVATTKENEISSKEADICDTEYSNSFKISSKNLSYSTKEAFSNVSQTSQSVDSTDAIFANIEKDPIPNDPIIFEKSDSNEATFKETEIEYISNAHCLATLFNDSKKKYSPAAVYKIDSSKLDKDLHCPTVSVVLQESMSDISKSNLKRWKEDKIGEIGEEQFDLYFKAQIEFGGKLRKKILDQLQGKSIKRCPKNMQGFWDSLLPVFPLFHDLKDIKRTAVHSTLGYKGMIDCLVEFRNKLMLVSWKKSYNTVPTLDRTFDTPLQIAAYVGAINFDRSYPFTVEDALLVMSYSDGTKADIFHLNNEKLLHYWKLWLRRLKIYEKQLKNIDVRSSDTRMEVDFPTEKLNIDDELMKIATKVERNTHHGIDIKSEDHKIGVNCIVSDEANSRKIDGELKKNTNDSETTNTKTFNNVIPTAESIELMPENVQTKITEQNIRKIESCLEFPLYNEEKNQSTTELKIELDQDHQYVSYPAVTTVLSETKSETAKFLLERWKQNLILQLGIEGFEEYQKNLLSMGSSFHKLVQDYLLGIPEEKLQILPELQGCWDSLKPVFPLISGVKMNEGKVVHEVLKYKGIIDCVAQFRDKLVIIDWKKSDKIKSTISMTYDGPLQVAAYIGALNFDSNYTFKVDEGILVVSYTDGTKADIFYIDKKNCLKYWKLWLERLHKYRTSEIKESLKIKY